MNTPVSNRPLLTAFRTNYRPRVVKNQHELSSLVASPSAGAPAANQPSSMLNDTTIRTLSDQTVASEGLFSALDRTGWSYRVEYAVDEIIRDNRAYQPDVSIYGDINRQFNATLSTLIVIASGDIHISEEHLLWSEAFLRGIRDRYGNHPPNVRKMLGFIRHIREEQAGAASRRSSTRDSAADTTELFVQTYQDNVPANVTLTRIPPPSSNATI